MKTLLDWAEDEEIFAQPLVEATSEHREQIRETWRQFADLSMQLDILKSKYKGFYQIDRMTKRELHADAFCIQFAAFLAQYKATLRLVNIVDQNPSMDAFLNEKIANGNNTIPEGSYMRVKQRLTNPEVMIRLNAWSCYFPLVEKDFSETNMLSAKLDQDVEYIYKSLGKRPSLLITNPRDIFEKRVFTAWFPFQKEVALQVGGIRSPTHEYQIGTKTINKHLDLLRPGDIIIERRSWKMSNVSIPGFWTHMAFYTGTPDEIDQYFAGLPLLEGKKPTEYLAENHPTACRELTASDENGHPHAVIEALSPGVVFNSPQFTFNADYVAVLRPRLSRSTKFESLCEAISHYGKPYDFNFNFATDNQMVCSELVYKALSGLPRIDLTPQRLNGRLMLTPNSFAKLFDREYGKPDAQFDFVLFLDSDKQGAITAKDAASFRKTWQRPKWEFLMQH